MSRFLLILLGCSAIASLLVLLFANSKISQSLSPQGCRMSWMSPSYILQADFNTTWTPLAARYSLWLYREVDWETHQLLGTPVLFIPGNGGTAHQIRSVASSATRQFYNEPYVVAEEFLGKEIKPLDFFSVEFNEDLSAFHGPTLDSQIAYTTQAIAYILSQYPPNTSIIVLGHSMGGIVGTALLPHPDIIAIITMSTPQILPPARFDSRIDQLYETNIRKIHDIPTPVLALCGGAADGTIPSESCILPELDGPVFRRTIFTSALEGAWTGVGHKEMVWCHQVRWRIARAALELGTVKTPEQRGQILDKWLRDGHRLPLMPKETDDLVLTDSSSYKTLARGSNLVIENPQEPFSYLLPVSGPKFVLFVSQGAIPPVAPQNSNSLRVTAYLCPQHGFDDHRVRCSSLAPQNLKLVPNPVLGRPFPLPNEGTDESEGVVLYEAEVSVESEYFIAVRVEGADGRGWIIGGFVDEGPVEIKSGLFDLLMGSTSVQLPNRPSLLRRITLPNLPANALLVYRLSRYYSPQTKSNCSAPLFPPLLSHTSIPSETHYFPLSSPFSRPVLIHTHSTAPYTPIFNLDTQGVNLIIYSSGLSVCGGDLTGFDITLDWTSTLGRMASRYPTTLVSWTVGVAALVLFLAWEFPDQGAPMPSISQSLRAFNKTWLSRLALTSLAVGVLPLPESYYLGMRGEIIFAPLAPVFVIIASGLVCVTWWMLCILMWPIGKIGIVLFNSRKQSTGVRRGGLISMCLVFILIFLFIPWQVAYLGCWLILLCLCATHEAQMSSPPSLPRETANILLLKRVSGSEIGIHKADPTSASQRTSPAIWREDSRVRLNNHRHNLHILLFMTWLLPLTAPVLAVWVRTLLTAGFTTPFDGDHFFPIVAPFLVLVDYTSWTRGSLFIRSKFESQISARLTLLLVAFTAFFVGPRAVYRIFEATSLSFTVIVALRIGSRYLKGSGSVTST